MRAPSLIAATGLLLLATLPGSAASAPSQWVRDQIRINMRTGPGNQYRILRVLTSGDEVNTLKETDGWVNVRTPDGEEGWVPEGYVIDAIPPSVSLPRIQARFDQAQAKIEELEAQLAAQSEAVHELETLRGRNAELEQSHTVLASSAMWRNIATGGLIAFGGMLVGFLWPRDRGTRARRIKL